MFRFIKLNSRNLLNFKFSNCNQRVTRFFLDTIEGNREIRARRNLQEAQDTLLIPLGRDYGVSCIRVHISEIGEIDVPGTWGQCKYYAYRGTSEGGKDYRCGRGECAPDGYRPPFLVSTTPGTRSSLSALKCANNRSALSFHLGMPLFRSTNNIRVLFLFLSTFLS